jgi:hypothetical protein
MFVPLSKDEEAEIRAVLAETNNCQMHLDRVWQIIDEKDKIRYEKNKTKLLASLFDFGDPVTVCNYDLENWQAGGRFENHFPLSKYLALNAIAAVAGFAAIFGLSYLLPALARRWRWLNT